MGLTKRIFIDKDPAYESVRKQHAKETSAYLNKFKHRIPTRRRNRDLCGSYWDPYWPSSIARAAEKLSIEIVYINDGAFVRTHEEWKKLKALAEEVWKERKGV